MKKLVEAFAMYVMTNWHEDIAESLSEYEVGVEFDIPEWVTAPEDEFNKWWKEADAFCWGWNSAKGTTFRAHYSWGFGDRFIRIFFQEE